MLLPWKVLWVANFFSLFHETNVNQIVSFKYLEKVNAGHFFLGFLSLYKP